MDKRLTRLGFRGRQADAVRTFQATYRRGPYGKKRLVVDGILGPTTRAALDHCLKNGGHASQYFLYTELQCRCGGKYPDCRGVLIDRPTLELLNWVRREYFPGGLSPASVYRCPSHNRAVGGASASKHLEGKGFDLPLVIPLADVDRLPRTVGGVGHQFGRIRHLDTRDRVNGQTTQWSY